MSLRSVVPKLLVAAAFVLIASLIYSSWPTIRGMLSTTDWRSLALAVLTLTLSNVGMALVFSGLLRRGSKHPAIGRGAAGAFLIAQVGKYLPGKIWGLAIQATIMNATGSTSAILAANLEVAIANIFAVSGVGLAFLVWHQTNTLTAVCILAGTWLITASVLGMRVTARAAHASARWLPLRFRNSLPAPTADVPPRDATLRYGGLLLFLTMYSFGWWLLAAALTSSSVWSSMAIVAAFSLAYIVGVVSLLPAGIGAREGTLVLLAPTLGLPHIDMAALAVTSRAAILLMDVLAACIGALLLRANHPIEQNNV